MQRIFATHFFRLKVGSSLSIAELLRVSVLLRVALRASDYGKRDHEPGEEDDALDAMFRELAPVVSLAKEIDAVSSLRRRSLMMQATDFALCAVP